MESGGGEEGTTCSSFALPPWHASILGLEGPCSVALGACGSTRTRTSCPKTHLRLLDDRLVLCLLAFPLLLPTTYHKLAYHHDPTFLGTLTIKERLQDHLLSPSLGS